MSSVDLNEEIQNARRHLIAQIRIPLQKTGNIGEILLTFAATPTAVRHSPNLPLKHVLDTRNWKRYAQHAFWRGVLSKAEVARISLNLNSQVRFRLGEIDTVWKSLDGENLATERFDSLPGLQPRSRYPNPN